MSIGYGRTVCDELGELSIGDNVMPTYGVFADGSLNGEIISLNGAQAIVRTERKGDVLLPINYLLLSM